MRELRPSRARSRAQRRFSRDGLRPGRFVSRAGACALVLAAAVSGLLLWLNAGTIVGSVQALQAGAGGEPDSRRGVPGDVRSWAATVCGWARGRYPGLRPPVEGSRLFFLYTGPGPAYYDCGGEMWTSVGLFSPIYLRNCAAGKAPCDSPFLGGFASSMLIGGASRGACDAVVLLRPGRVRRSGYEEYLRRVFLHEYVVHCGLSGHLTVDEREALLEQIAERVPFSRLRAWFGGRDRDAYYRALHGISGEMLTASGHVDTSSRNPFTTSRQRALGYVEEAFAALVDSYLLGEDVRRLGGRDAFENRIAAFAMWLDQVAAERVNRGALGAVISRL